MLLPLLPLEPELELPLLDPELELERELELDRPLELPPDREADGALLRALPPKEPLLGLALRLGVALRLGLALRLDVVLRLGLTLLLELLLRLGATAVGCRETLAVWLPLLDWPPPDGLALR